MLKRRRLPTHFTVPLSSVHEGQSYLEALASLSPKSLAYGEMLIALVKAETVLRDLAATPEQKTNALKFVLHFTGDMHQPLHTAGLKTVAPTTSRSIGSVNKPIYTRFGITN